MMNEVNVVVKDDNREIKVVTPEGWVLTFKSEEDKRAYLDSIRE